jgi:DNA topoisomerase-1
MKLVIVESPSKAKTIEKYLGKEFKVVGSGGHIRDLPERTLGINIRNSFQPQYELKEKMKKNITQLKRDVEKAETVYLATDPDREGEAISWHLSETLGINPDNSRIVFNEISKKAVKSALEHPRALDMNLVNAQQARRVLDRIVGYMVSPIISKKIRSGLSAGRVQSAALKMIVDREKEITAFVPQEYWNLYGYFIKLKGSEKAVKAEFNDVCGEKVKVTDGKQAEKIITAVKAVKDWRVDNVKRGTQTSYPKPPFTTSTLQQDASSRFGISTSVIMASAQKLYEGVELDGEHIALVTYIRTDSVRVAYEAIDEARSVISERYGSAYLPLKPPFYKNKDSAQDAHEAIRPITLSITPDSLEGTLDRNLLRLYRLIYERFVASQMTPATYDTIAVRVEGGKEKFGFRMQGRLMTFKGYTAVYSGKGEDEEENSLPDYRENEPLIGESFTSEQKFTQPPGRYTESTLVKAMEENGIGRPSTYATVIQTLGKRFYTEKDKKSIKPTETGMLVCEAMTKFFPDIMDLNFTANMENELDSIDGGKPWQNILYDFYPGFYEKLQAAMKDRTSYKAAPEVSDKVCSKCGKPMLIRTGRYGKFYACSGYPDCKNILPFDEPVGKCPKCGGDIFKKKTKHGKTFYGCSNYPKCDFVSWDMPAPILCPDCGGPMKVEGKESKKYVCNDKKCGKTVIADSEVK